MSTRATSKRAVSRPERPPELRARLARRLAYSGLSLVTAAGGSAIRCRRMPATSGSQLARTTPTAGRIPIPGEPATIDRQLTFDRLQRALLRHRHAEDQPSHLIVHDTDICRTRCRVEYGNPCTRFCPANVYEMVDDGEGGKRCRSTRRTACTARRATSWTRIRSSTGSRRRAAEDRTMRECRHRELTVNSARGNPQRIEAGARTRKRAALGGGAPSALIMMSEPMVTALRGSQLAESRLIASRGGSSCSSTHSPWKSRGALLRPHHRRRPRSQSWLSGTVASCPRRSIGDRNIVVITSANFDGEWIARIIQRFGYGTARARRRGVARALVQMP